MVYVWELELIKSWTINEIRNRIWMEIECGQPIPGNVSVKALRTELSNRGEKPIGYHNT